MADVYVLADLERGRLTDLTFELLTAGRELATSLHVPLKAVLLTNEAGMIAPSLGFADGVVAMSHVSLGHRNLEAWSRALLKVIDEKQPKVVLIGISNGLLGLPSLVAGARDLPLISLCRSVAAHDDEIVADPVLYGGKIEAEVHAKGGPVVVAVRPGSYSAEPARVQRSVPIENVDPPEGLETRRVRFKGLADLEQTDVDITHCDVLVSIGRGIQNQENIRLAEELAGLFRNAAVSSSRPLVDQGWLPRTRQVGRSGMTVKPRLYLALGISGAPEHIEGMKGAETIVAVNTDAKAPVFEYAHYGVVADILTFIPRLAEQLRKKHPVTR